jgi:hypothetical protein
MLAENGGLCLTQQQKQSGYVQDIEIRTETSESALNKDCFPTLYCSADDDLQKGYISSNPMCSIEISHSPEPSSLKIPGLQSLPADSSCEKVGFGAQAAEFLNQYGLDTLGMENDSGACSNSLENAGKYNSFNSRDHKAASSLRDSYALSKLHNSQGHEQAENDCPQMKSANLEAVELIPLEQTSKTAAHNASTSNGSGILDSQDDCKCSDDCGEAAITLIPRRHQRGTMLAVESTETMASSIVSESPDDRISTSA